MAVTHDNIVRLVVIILAIVALFAMTSVMIMHWQAWHRRENKRDGLMPKHVAVVSFSYAILALGIALGLYELLFGSIGIPQIVRTYMYGIAFIAGLYALYVVGSLQRKTPTPQKEIHHG